MNFSATIRQSGEVSLVEVSGRLTFVEVGGLIEGINTLLKQGRKNILLNLSGLHYLDSSGIGELARVYTTVLKKGGEMKVVGLSAKVEEVLKMTRLYEVFPEFPDEQSALQSFPPVHKNK